MLDAAALRGGEPHDSFAAVQQYHFEQDMAALAVHAPAHELRAHRYVPQVIRLAAGPLEGGAAYARDGSVYFRGPAAVDRAALGQAAAGWGACTAPQAARGVPTMSPESAACWPRT